MEYHRKLGDGLFCFGRITKCGLVFQRLKPGDPILSFRQCERHTFSMRPDREVAYSIRVQHFDADSQCHLQNTGVLTQKLGLGAKTSKSQVGYIQQLWA